MATRARIGLKLEDGSIISAYHHWDGYPEWLGVTLKEQYNTKEKIAKLIDGGNMSSCYSDNEYDEEIEQSLNIPEGVNSWFQLCEYVVNNICVDGVEIEEISAC